MHAVQALRADGYETVMVNCNPETVSTDYDTSDRLYFEPLTFEDVSAIIAREQESGADVKVVVQYGGQTPLKLALPLQRAGVLLLVDVYGSTPFNVAMTMADGTRSAEVVCGVNLPMLLKVATLDRCKLSPATLAAEVQECGRRSIRIGSDLTGKVTLGGKI